MNIIDYLFKKFLKFS